MPNLTITAEENTSVARLVGDLLKERMRAERGYQAAKRRFLGVKARVLSSGPYPSRDELHDRPDLR